MHRALRPPAGSEPESDAELTRLEASVATDARFALGYAKYRNPNVFDFLFSLDADRRRDLYGELGVKLTRPIHRFVQLELAWRGIRRASNVELYDYDRHVVGLYVRAFSN